jgi:DnaJ-class molecular chaperone
MIREIVNDFVSGKFLNTQQQQQPPATTNVVKDAPIRHELLISLEQINSGCCKTVKITRKIYDADHYRVEEKLVNVIVDKGCPSGTTITFANEGDVHAGRMPADVIFVIRDKPHGIFRRESANIYYMKRVHLRDALCGLSTSIPGLDGSSIPLIIDHVIKPNTSHRLVGYGLPIPKYPGKRGDLIVDFELEFPNTIHASVKDRLRGLL